MKNQTSVCVGGFACVCEGLALMDYASIIVRKIGSSENQEKWLKIGKLS